MMADRTIVDVLLEDLENDCDNLKDLLTLMWSIAGFAVAFPNAVHDHTRLRYLLQQFGADMPPFRRRNVEEEKRPCMDCQVLLNIGSHLARSGVAVLCPLCAIRRLE